MKTKNNIFKTAFIAFALICSAQTFAQVFPSAPTLPVSVPADLKGGTVTFDGSNESYDNNPTANTVAYYKPDTGTGSVTGVILEASLDDNGTAFSNYIWYEISYTGGAETANQIGTGSTNTFTVSNLTSGYHKYRVRGEVGSTVVCPSDEYQDMIVFVLPELDVDLANVTGTLTYCEDAVPTGVEAVQLSAGAITADYTDNTNDYPKPGETDATADFALTYHWYAVPVSAPTTTIDLGTATTADVDLTTLMTASSASLVPDTYTFYVEVEYVNSIRDNSVAPIRSYVIYGGVGTVTTSQVVITPIPGTPTISVDSVLD